MPVHTIEISLPLITDVTQAERLMHLFHIPQYKINKVMNIKPDQKKAAVYHKLSRAYPNLGIKYVRMYRDAAFPLTGGLAFLLMLKIEPQIMLEGERTINLFHCTPENIARLEEVFHDAITNFISEDGYPEFVNLSCWDCNRIDYTQNLRFESNEDATLFLHLSKRTSMFMRRRAVKMNPLDPDEPIDIDQSTAERNKASKVIFYKKNKQIRETYGGIPQEEMQRLLDDAEGIIRYEVQCKGSKVSSLKKSWQLPSRSVIHFLNEDLISNLLYKNYCETIGPGNFMYLPMIDTAIKQSGYATRLKNALIRTEHLIAQSRSIAQGKVNFASGNYRVKGIGIVKGTEVTFRSHLKKIANINVNPYPIPKDWVKGEDKLFMNPIEQLCLELDQSDRISDFIE